MMRVNQQNDLFSLLFSISRSTLLKMQFEQSLEKEIVLKQQMTDTRYNRLEANTLAANSTDLL